MLVYLCEVVFLVCSAICAGGFVGRLAVPDLVRCAIQRVRQVGGVLVCCVCAGGGWQYLFVFVELVIYLSV